MIDVKEVSSKKQALIERLRALDSLLVAFSGGVDSTFLLALARQALGEKVVACTATSIVYPSRESKEAVSFAKEKGAHHVIMATDAMSLPGFIANKPDRCYHCKRYLFEKLKELAAQRGIKHIAHAANLDDLKDYRPGWRAAEEMGILAPLVDARLTKEEIRFLSREMGLASWNKPTMACLASRIPFDEPITEKKLRMIQEAEEFITGLGFAQYRVRYHGAVARIEVEPEDIQRIVEKTIRDRIVAKLKEIGFLHVALDLEGYVSGSMNRGLKTVKVEKQSRKHET
jgi:uncharacterized protein